MKKQRIIGAAIAFVALVMVFFLPLGHMGGTQLTTYTPNGPVITTTPSVYYSLSELLVGYDSLPEESAKIYTIVWLILLIFPIFGIVANLIGKLRVLAAWLMLIPFIWGLLPHGIAVWVYGVLTVLLIVYSMIMKKKAKKEIISSNN